MQFHSATDQIWTDQGAGLCFEAQQIQSAAQEFHHIIWRKKGFATDTKSD